MSSADIIMTEMQAASVNFILTFCMNALKMVMQKGKIRFKNNNNRSEEGYILNNASQSGAIHSFGESRWKFLNKFERD